MWSLEYSLSLSWQRLTVHTKFFAIIAILSAVPVAISAQTVVISEFMAANNSTLQDEDGDYPDWVEVHNLGSSPVDLENWALSDDPNDLFQWRFPAVSVPAGGFLTVFCSDKSRADPAAPLHSSFRLTSLGEYLALTRPDGEIEWQFSPLFPPQISDVSMGFPQDAVEGTLISTGSNVKFLVPSDDTLGMDWTLADFDDSGWNQGPTGIGFDQKSSPTYGDLIATDIGPLMQSNNASVYLRFPFDLDDLSTIHLLLLRMRFEDGFVAHVNGVEVARNNFDDLETPLWNSRARRSRLTSIALGVEIFDLSNAVPFLTTGRNVLAIQGLNNSAASSDFFLLPELASVAVGTLETDQRQFFELPTPGRPNGRGFALVSRDPAFSVPEGTYVDQVTVEVTSPAPDAVLRYTLDGSNPDRESPIYEGPIVLTNSTVVKARLFEEGQLPSRTAEQPYIIISADLSDFSSNLPIVIVNTFGTPIGGVTFAPGHLTVIDVEEDGRSRMNGPVHFAGSAGFKVRGSSTANRPKQSYSVEIWDSEQEDRDVSILGFPAESDWILYGPYNFDPALMRNAFIYELSNQVGRWAARTRFVEVFLNRDQGPVEGPVPSGDYWGVYVFMEKIKRGPDRVDVQALDPSDVDEPQVSGGYILKVDRADPGDRGLDAGGQNLKHVYPKEEEIQNVSAQVNWLRSFMNRMQSSLSDSDPETGYEQFIDVDSWIDHHLLNVLPMNVDMLRLSGYMHKRRSGKLVMGPIWDFDRSMESTDSRDNNPRAWNGTGDATRAFSFPWWITLFADENFDQRYQARWRELRTNEFSTANLHAIIDRMAEELNEAQERDFGKWRQGKRGGWQGEIQLLKDWLQTRAEWIDGQFLPVPVFSHEGGMVTGPIELTMTFDGDEGAVVVYTLDGSDPMDSTSAIEYEEGVPVSITENVLLRARVRTDNNIWSDLREAVYVVSIPTIALTEIMYNPLGSTDLEFVEIHNFGDVPVRLRNARFSRGVTFSFGDEAPEFLQPGAYLVVARDLAAFAAHYDVAPDVQVLGDYSGSLSDRGETLTFEGSVTEEVFSFRYDESWHPSTDGLGNSLVLVDPTSSPETWGEAASWRASILAGGSPGTADTPCETSTCGVVFRRGDCDQSGALDFNDAIFHLKFLFLGENEDQVNLCRDACDSDDSGTDDFTDDINSLKFLFLGQGDIPSPGPLPDESHPCGTDLTEGDTTDCVDYSPTIACP